MVRPGKGVRRTWRGRAVPADKVQRFPRKPTIPANVGDWFATLTRGVGKGEGKKSTGKIWVVTQETPYKTMGVPGCLAPKKGYIFDMKKLMDLLGNAENAGIVRRLYQGGDQSLIRRIRRKVLRKAP